MFQAIILLRLFVNILGARCNIQDGNISISPASASGCITIQSSGFKNSVIYFCSGTSTKYTINFSNALYNPHSGHNATAGGIVSSTGFKIEGDTTNIWYLDDDGAGNIRRYRQDGSVRAYGNSTQGTIDYSSGKVEVNSLNVSNIENVRGVASTVIEVTVKPNSNDIVPIRNQVLDMDIANSTVTVEADTLVGGSANAGIGYTTTSSY